MAKRKRTTFLAVLRATREVTSDPEFTGEGPELAVAVAEKLMGCEVERAGEFGWDMSELLELIAKWLPLILKLLSLF